VIKKVRRIGFDPAAWEQYRQWADNDAKVLERINNLAEDIARDPFRGLGKPEPLKGNLAGFWSRRIDNEHRLVYQVDDAFILIAQCKYHYKV